MDPKAGIHLKAVRQSRTGWRSQAEPMAGFPVAPPFCSILLFSDFENAVGSDKSGRDQMTLSVDLLTDTLFRYEDKVTVLSENMNEKHCGPVSIMLGDSP